MFGIQSITCASLSDSFSGISHPITMDDPTIYPSFVEGGEVAPQMADLPAADRLDIRKLIALRYF